MPICFAINATIFEATEVLNGKALTVGSGFAPAVEVTSLTGHGEVDHHKGVDGKDYGDKFELLMPMSWHGRSLYGRRILSFLRRPYVYENTAEDAAIERKPK